MERAAEAEDARQLHRELMTVKQDRTRVTNRIRALLATQGVLEMEVGPGCPERLGAGDLGRASPSGAS